MLRVCLLKCFCCFRKVYKYVLTTYYMERETAFMHTVSKGSRFNQIYIPVQHKSSFEVGDSVEVRLLRKHTRIFYSGRTKKLTEFKEKVVSDIFSILSKNKKVEQILVFGSFLTKETDYNDIDILLFSQEDIEEEAYDELIGKLNLKFHVLSVKKDELMKTLKICPVTRSMLNYFVSNKELKISPTVRLDKNHLNYLLMMPEDLLKAKFDNGRVYYEALRKLLSIKGFLQGKEIAPDKIDSELLKIIDSRILQRLKDNLIINDFVVEKVQGIIGEELKEIYRLIKQWEKESR